jgi:hypothetical protein
MEAIDLFLTLWGALCFLQGERLSVGLLIETISQNTKTM